MIHMYGLGNRTHSVPLIHIHIYKLPILCRACVMSFNYIYLDIISFNKHHHASVNPLKGSFIYGRLCFALLLVVTFAHFGTAFWQDIFIILEHFLTFNILQIQFLVFSVHQTIKLYDLQGNRLLKS